MMKSLKLASLLFAAALLADAQGPITLKAITGALRGGDASTSELANLVKIRGVDFKLTPAGESELRAAGAQDDLLTAVKANHREASVLPSALPASRGTSGKPLTKSEVLTLLEVGTPSERISELAAQRGLAFKVTDQVALELKKAGADSKLISRISKYGTPSSPGARPAKGPVFNRALIDPAGQIGNAPAVLIDIQSIFVEDSELRNEVLRQLSGRVVVPSTREQADAILRKGGSLVDKAGNVLWSPKGQPKAAAVVAALKEALR